MILGEEDADTNIFIHRFNTAVTETANEVLLKERVTKKPWVTSDILRLCDQRRKLKKFKYDSDEGTEKYR